MILTDKNKKELTDLAEKTAFDSFCNIKKKLWKDSLIWKEAQKEFISRMKKEDIFSVEGKYLNTVYTIYIPNKDLTKT